MREGTSLDGSTPLLRREFPAERRQKLQADLVAAEADHTADPDGVDAIVWHARRLGYLDRFTEAIAVLTSGLEIHPDEPQLYRHRGHRYITTNSSGIFTAHLLFLPYYRHAYPSRERCPWA